MEIIYILLGLIALETTYLVVDQISKRGRTKSQKPIFVDTSVLIDGRIISIAEAGFVPGQLNIPRSVVGELQLLADNGDSDKRVKARHGLDIIRELQSIDGVDTIIFSDSTSAREGVDNRLLSLAKKYNGSICTVDYNLNKVAQVENIQVLNINELAKTLRMAYLPGETTTLELTQKGSDAHQAVGHLGDGTMVVVENASQKIGKAVEVEFVRSLQTAAGKMMFAKLVNKGRRSPNSSNSSNSSNTTASGKLQKSRKPTGRGQNTHRKSPPRRLTAEDSLVDLANN